MVYLSSPQKKTIAARLLLLHCSFSGGDSSLLFGEISGSALAGIEAALSRFLKPLLSESDGWGKADTEQKVIFLGIMNSSVLLRSNMALKQALFLLIGALFGSGFIRSGGCSGRILGYGRSHEAPTHPLLLYLCFTYVIDPDSNNIPQRLEWSQK